MSKAKRKQKISINKLDNISQRLGKLSKKPKSELNLRESINYLQPKLNRALAQGYSYVDLSEILAEQDIKISASTLKQYLVTSPKKTIRKKKKLSLTVPSNLRTESDISSQPSQNKKPISIKTKSPTNQADAAIDKDIPTLIHTNNSVDNDLSQNTNNQESRPSILSGIDQDLSSEFNQY